jgi:hypothetical protein
MVRLKDYSARRAILMAKIKMPSHYGTANLAKADMMIGRHFAPLVMNLPLWFGSNRPEQARLSNIIHSPTSPALCHRISLAWLLTRFLRGIDLLMLRQTR